VKRKKLAPLLLMFVVQLYVGVNTFVDAVRGLERL
jgi:hypothetical protein